MNSFVEYNLISLEKESIQNDNKLYVDGVFIVYVTKYITADIKTYQPCK